MGAVFLTSSGGIPSRKNPSFYTGNIKWIKTKELNNSVLFDSEEKITNYAIKKSSAKLFPPKTVLIAMYGATIGETAILFCSATTNQACCAILPKEKNIYQFFIFQLFINEKESLFKRAQGAAQNNISQAVIKNYPILIPCEKYLESFNSSNLILYNYVFNLKFQNQLLKQARDLLLPRLMKGEIEV